MIELLNGFVCFCGLSLLNEPWRMVPLLLPLFGSVPTDLACRVMTLPSIKTIGTCKFSNPKTWPNVKLENNYHIPDLVQAFPKKMVG
jgi:hypothetical protein